jgi:hypothetical protein
MPGAMLRRHETGFDDRNFRHESLPRWGERILRISIDLPRTTRGLRCPVVHHIAAQFVRFPAAIRRAEPFPDSKVFAKLQVIDIAEFIFAAAKTCGLTCCYLFRSL